MGTILPGNEEEDCLAKHQETQSASIGLDTRTSHISMESMTAEHAHDTGSVSINSTNPRPRHKADKRLMKGKKIKRKWPKDRPKRPLTAYNFFFQQERENIISSAASLDGENNSSKTHGSCRKVSGVGFEGLARNVAAKWKTLNTTEKSIFEAQAAMDKIRYKNEVAVWEKHREEKETISNSLGQAQLPTTICSQTLQSYVRPFTQALGHALLPIDHLRNETFAWEHMNNIFSAVTEHGNVEPEGLESFNLESPLQSSNGDNFRIEPSKQTTATSFCPIPCGSSNRTMNLKKTDKVNTESSIWCRYFRGSGKLGPSIDLLTADDEFMDFLQEFEEE